VSRLILVVANETVESDVLHETVYFLARNPPGEVIVVAPALNSRLRHWLSDEDRAREGAEARLRRCLDRLEDAGIEARGWVGDADPLQAIADVIHVFAPDEIVIATHPQGRSHWLAENLVERVRARYPQPVLHLVADPLLPQRAIHAA
jgi:nucleotide-binding universal stress UspA family protein